MKIELNLNELMILEQALKQSNKYSDEVSLYKKILSYLDCQRAIDRADTAIKSIKDTYPD